jgi:hypothetical protein
VKHVLGGGLMLFGGVAIILWALDPINPIVVAVGVLVACFGWGTLTTGEDLVPRLWRPVGQGPVSGAWRAVHRRYRASRIEDNHDEEW